MRHRRKVHEEAGQQLLLRGLGLDLFRWRVLVERMLGFVLRSEVHRIIDVGRGSRWLVINSRRDDVEMDPRVPSRPSSQQGEWSFSEAVRGSSGATPSDASMRLIRSSSKATLNSSIC